jgi:hypothetical protein
MTVRVCCAVRGLLRNRSAYSQNVMIDSGSPAGRVWGGLSGKSRRRAPAGETEGMRAVRGRDDWPNRRKSGR